MAKKKLKRRKPKPEPEVNKDSAPLVSKKKVARVQFENEKRFPASESVASSIEFKKIKGRLTRTKRASRGS